MCGIVGLSFRAGGTRNISKNVQIFTDMLVAAQSRGSSATGVFLTRFPTQESKPKVYTLKAPLTAKEFVSSKEYKELMAKVDNTTYYIVGHTRAVTGDAPAKLNVNNHPHVAGSFIGVHNGGVMNYSELRKRYSGGPPLKSTCDSEIIFALADKARQDGAIQSEDALEKSLNKINAWYAVVAADMKKPAKLLLAKDNTTPLHLFWSEKEEIAYFASVRQYVLGAAEKNKLSYDLEEKVFPANTILTIDSTTKSTQKYFFVTARTIKSDKKIDTNSSAFKISQGLG